MQKIIKTEVFHYALTQNIELCLIKAAPSEGFLTIAAICTFDIIDMCRPMRS